MSKKVFIKSIPRDTATKIHELTNFESSGKKLNKNKIGNCKDAFQALYSRQRGALNTGLDGMTEDPATGNQITLQSYMEKKWNKPQGYFTPAPFKGFSDNKNQELTYFQTKVWKLNDGTTVLDMENMDDELFYYVCLASKFVANSEKEWKEHRWPKAMYYIAMENESDSIKHSKREKRRQAMAALEHEYMTPTMRRDFVSILVLANSFSKLTPEQVNNTLDDYIDNSNLPDPTGKTSIDKFMDLFELTKTDMGRETLKARLLLQQLIDTRIVFEKQGTYRWLKKDLIIGDRYREAIEFLLNPKKLVDREDLEEELKAKIK